RDVMPPRRAQMERVLEERIVGQMHALLILGGDDLLGTESHGGSWPEIPQLYPPLAERDRREPRVHSPASEHGGRHEDGADDDHSPGRPYRSQGDEEEDTAEQAAPEETVLYGPIIDEDDHVRSRRRRSRNEAERGVCKATSAMRPPNPRTVWQPL